MKVAFNPQRDSDNYEVVWSGGPLLPARAEINLFNPDDKPAKRLYHRKDAKPLVYVKENV